MPTRDEAIARATRVFEAANYPDGLSLSSAWLGIYQTLLWYERIDWAGFTWLPHIIDTNELRPANASKKQSWVEPRPWQRRAHAVSAYLAEHLKCSIDEMPAKTDLFMKLPEYDGMQRQNPAGTAFIGLIKHVLEKFGPGNLSYEAEVVATSIFPGVAVPGRSGTPKIDLLVRHNQIPRAIISAKWSLRHDRLSDFTNECPLYKAAYQRIYRAQRTDLLYFVVTNEYAPARLGKVMEDTCIDGVIHAHKPAVTEVCQLDGKLADLVDLVDFVNSTVSW